MTEKFIDPEEEAKRSFISLLSQLKSESSYITLGIGFMSIVGFLLIGIFDIIYRLNIFKFFVALIYLYICYYLTGVLVSNPDGRAHQFYRFWSIGGLVASYVSGANIGVSLILVSAGFIYIDNTRQIMRRINRTMKNFFFEYSDTLNVSQATNTSAYISDRISWNRTTTFLTVFLTSVGYFISLFLQDTFISDSIETLALIIVIVIVTPKFFMSNYKKEVDDVLEERKRVFRVAHNLD